MHYDSQLDFHLRWAWRYQRSNQNP